VVDEIQTCQSSFPNQDSHVRCDLPMIGPQLHNIANVPNDNASTVPPQTLSDVGTAQPDSSDRTSQFPLDTQSADSHPRGDGRLGSVAVMTVETVDNAQTSQPILSTRFSESHPDMTSFDPQRGDHLNHTPIGNVPMNPPQTDVDIPQSGPAYPHSRPLFEPPFNNYQTLSSLGAQATGRLPSATWEYIGYGLLWQPIPTQYQTHWTSYLPKCHPYQTYAQLLPPYIRSSDAYYPYSPFYPDAMSVAPAQPFKDQTTFVPREGLHQQPSLHPLDGPDSYTPARSQTSQKARLNSDKCHSLNSHYVRGRGRGWRRCLSFNGLHGSFAGRGGRSMQPSDNRHDKTNAGRGRGFHLYSGKIYIHNSGRERGNSERHRYEIVATPASAIPDRVSSEDIKAASPGRNVESVEDALIKRKSLFVSRADLNSPPKALRGTASAATLRTDSDIVPNTLPQNVQGATSSSIPNISSVINPNTALDATANIISDAGPEVTRDAVPQVVRDTVPNTAAAVAPDTAPNTHSGAPPSTPLRTPLRTPQLKHTGTETPQSSCISTLKSHVGSTVHEGSPELVSSMVHEDSSMLLEEIWIDKLRRECEIDGRHFETVVRGPSPRILSNVPQEPENPFHILNQGDLAIGDIFDIGASTSDDQDEHGEMNYNATQRSTPDNASKECLIGESGSLLKTKEDLLMGHESDVQPPKLPLKGNLTTGAETDIPENSTMEEQESGKNATSIQKADQDRQSEQLNMESSYTQENVNGQEAHQVDSVAEVESEDCVPTIANSHPAKSPTVPTNKKQKKSKTQKRKEAKKKKKDQENADDADLDAFLAQTAQERSSEPTQPPDFSSTKVAEPDDIEKRIELCLEEMKGTTTMFSDYGRPTEVDETLHQVIAYYNGCGRVQIDMNPPVDYPERIYELWHLLANKALDDLEHGRLGPWEVTFTSGRLKPAKRPSFWQALLCIARVLTKQAIGLFPGVTLSSEGAVRHQHAQSGNPRISLGTSEEIFIRCFSFCLARTLKSFEGVDELIKAREVSRALLEAGDKESSGKIMGIVREKEISLLQVDKYILHQPHEHYLLDWPEQYQLYQKQLDGTVTRIGSTVRPGAQMARPPVYRRIR
jgi:hypothetical protein